MMCSRGRSNEPMVSVKYEEFINLISVLLIYELALSSFCEFITCLVDKCVTNVEIQHFIYQKSRQKYKECSCYHNILLYVLYTQIPQARHELAVLIFSDGNKHFMCLSNLLLLPLLQKLFPRFDASLTRELSHAVPQFVPCNRFL
jgi:hypothetical protein